MHKKFIILTVLFLTSSITFAQSSDTIVNKTAIHDGIGLGTVIAVAISWSRNKSILWAIIHGILSWFYVIYYFFTRGND